MNNGMTDEEKEIENEIEKLNKEIGFISLSIDELSKAKQNTETKLKQQLKKANELNLLNKQKISRDTSKTNKLLDKLECLYIEMYTMHGDAELYEKSKLVLDNYRTEFEGLISMYENLNKIDEPPKKISCPCQMKEEQQQKPERVSVNYTQPHTPINYTEYKYSTVTNALPPIITSPISTTENVNNNDTINPPLKLQPVRLSKCNACVIDAK